MTKIYAVILGGLILCAGGGRDLYAAVPRPTCKDSNLTPKQVEQIDCYDAKISNGQTCWQYCEIEDDPVILGVSKCVNFYYPDTDVRQFAGVLNGIRVYEKCVSEEQACVKAHGIWNSYEGCKCMGNDQVWNRVTGKCEDSDEYAACTQASDAQWDYKRGYCVCTDAFKTYWNKQTLRCELPPNQQECEKYSSFMRWDNNACICTKDENGNAIPNDRVADYALDKTCNNNAGCCKKKACVARRDQDAANAPAAQQQAQKINNIVADLEKYSRAFEKSHWKNASGGFNTARLASDSVAGVVLGTLGGVITSNVVKKNQVKSGFEDLNCVINGQVVSGFHDTFNVDIR